MRHQRMREVGRQEGGWQEDGLRQSGGRLGNLWHFQEGPEDLSLQAVLQDLEEGEEGRAQGVGVAQNQPAK